ncbi:hypothetical protein [Streptomyces sp. XD-27]|uniref:hypothetical protein n=1 Tax=Streptomyces sp. XD-27 TaxID=3062779 RepID=UPI00350E5589
MTRDAAEVLHDAVRALAPAGGANRLVPLIAAGTAPRTSWPRSPWSSATSSTATAAASATWPSARHRNRPSPRSSPPWRRTRPSRWTGSRP